MKRSKQWNRRNVNDRSQLSRFLAWVQTTDDRGMTIPSGTHATRSPGDFSSAKKWRKTSLDKSLSSTLLNSRISAGLFCTLICQPRYARYYWLLWLFFADWFSSRRSAKTLASLLKEEEFCEMNNYGGLIKRKKSQ